MADRGAPGGALMEHHAFLLRWGTSEEIRHRIAGVRGTAGWWASRGDGAGEDEVGDGLRRALAVLSGLEKLARDVEAALEARGYEFDRHLRVIRGARGRGARQPAAGDPLLEDTIGHLVRELRDTGQADENTVELRIRIRGLLARSLHPDLLTDATIRGVADRVFEPPPNDHE